MVNTYNLHIYKLNKNTNKDKNIPAGKKIKK